MRKLFYPVFLALGLIIALPMMVKGEIDIQDTKFLSQPAISKNHIAFVYSNDF